MTTTSSAIIKNADSTNAGSGAAVISLIVSEAARRPHLANAIKSVQWDQDRGVGILVEDAGHRKHLGRVFGFTNNIRAYEVRGIGVGFAEEGEIFGTPVIIWNLEV